MELEDRFASESACGEYLFELRWPQGFCCPRCATPGAWKTRQGLLMCPQCGYKQSVTAGTIFHRSRLPLRVWFRAMWWVTNQKTGVSALGLQRLMGFCSYKTAWAWLHKLRRAMVRSGRDRLTGEVEVDEAYVGGVEAGGGKRHLGKKALVGIAAQVNGAGIGRIRLRRIRDASSSSLVSFVESAVEPGAVVITDGWEGYDGLANRGYIHRPRVIRGSGRTASVLLPRVHQVTSLLKRWLLGTHQGAVSREQLDYYLDEFTFRFSRRTSRHRGKLFYRLLQQAVIVEPVPYSKLIAKAHKG